MMNDKMLTACTFIYKCLFLYYLSVSDAATVTLDVVGRLDDNNTLACDTNVTFVCTVKPVTDTMTWSIDGNVVSGCTFGVCYNGSSKPAHNLLEYDTSNGIYNWTFRPVLESDDRKVYKCEVGLDKAFVSPTVKVLPDETSSIITNATTSDGIVITASTCMSSGSLTFKWFIFKENEDRINCSINPNTSLDISSCSSTTNCQGRRSISTLNIKEHREEGEYFFFQVEIIYTFSPDVEPYILVVNSSHSFKLKGGIPCKIPCDIVCKLLIACGVLLFIAVIVGICLILYMIFRPTGKDDNTENEWPKIAHETLLHTSSALLWIVIASLYICLVIRCNCEDTCDCCVELPLGIAFGILFFIHLVLWFILLYVLYSRTGKGDNEGDIHLKTKLEKVRIIFSTIPLVGLFPVCGWLIRTYRCENGTIHKEQLTTEEKKNQLHSVTNPTNTKTEETRKQSLKIDKKERQRHQAKINQFIDQAIGSSEKDDQVSTSDVKPIETDTVEHSRFSTSGENSTKRKAFMKADSEVNTNKQKNQKENSAFTNSGTKQPSHNNGNVITSSHEHDIKHKMNVSDNRNHVSQRKADVTETKTRSENKPGSKDDVKREKRKSRKAANMVHAEAHNGNIDVTSAGSEDKLGSSDNDNPSNSSMSGKALPRRNESRKQKDDNKNPRNTKPGSADSRNGSETMKRALSANFHDEEDATTSVSIDSSTNM